MILFDWGFIATLIWTLQRLHTESGSEIANLVEAEVLPGQRNFTTAHSHQHYVEE